MKKPVNPQLNRQILDEASEWFVDFRLGDIDAGARQRFDEWLRRSPEHIRAYWEIAKTYVELPHARSVGALRVDELIAYARSDTSINIVPLPVSSGTRALSSRCAQTPSTEVPHRAGRPSPHARRPVFAAACAAFVLVVLAAFYWQAHRYRLYVTDIGERRSITLADGSTVDLNARSKLRIEFSKTERRAELVEGQALFQVAKDRRRPFLVRSGDALVRAVGTQFDVYRKDSGTTVTVLEGRVAVYSTAHVERTKSLSQHDLPRASTKDSSSNSTAPRVIRPSSDSIGTAVTESALTGSSGSGAIFLSAGEQVTMTPDSVNTPTPQHADLNAATAWIQRKLIFEGSKLSDVVGEFNRYNQNQLVIEDPKLADFEISGVYSSTDPSSLLRFLQDQGLRVTKGDTEVRIDAH